MQKGLPYFGRRFFRFRSERQDRVLHFRVRFAAAPDGSLYALGRALSRRCRMVDYFCRRRCLNRKNIVTLIIFNIIS